MRQNVEAQMCKGKCKGCRFPVVIPSDCSGNCRRCSYSRFCPCGNRFIHTQLLPTSKKESQSTLVREIAIASIRHDSLPGICLAAYDDAMLEILGRIVQKFGQPRPLIVALERGTEQQGYRLIAGLDILSAARGQGQQTVQAQIADLNDYGAAVQFYRCELMRLDLSWENQARYLLALSDLYRKRYLFSPSYRNISDLSDLSVSRIRDVLHGFSLLESHGLSDGTILFPTLLRPIRDTYPETLQKEMIRGLVEEKWTRRRVTRFVTAKLTIGSGSAEKAMDQTLHCDVVDISSSKPDRGCASQLEGPTV